MYKSTMDQMGSEENQGSIVPVRNKTSLKFNAKFKCSTVLWLASSKQVLEIEA